MKILTLNTHSLVEPGYENKLIEFANVIQKERPQVFALQEVNQLREAMLADIKEGFVSCKNDGSVIREDNHAYRLAGILENMGMNYYWTWIGAKVGYGIYDEGMAIFSQDPIINTQQFFISRNQSYTNWKTRKVLGIETGKEPCWYFCVHMGWWDDEEEPFAVQWDNFQSEIRARIPSYEKVWLLGDFNSPAEIRGEGYDYIKNCGWQDSWDLAESKDDGITVGKVIDGWKERCEDGTAIKGMRIDQIWCNYMAQVKSSKVICNGENYTVVSDHYGIVIEAES